MTAGAVASRVEWLYGTDLVADVGVLHVSSGWYDASGNLASLKIGPDTPVSATDSFLLGLARARADAIITTGQILREEPDLTHDVIGSEDHDLVAWRRDRLGRVRPPRTVLLTSGRDLDWSHPLFRSAEPPLIFTGARFADQLADPARALGVRLVVHAEPSLEKLIQFLREEEGLGTISLEVGPRTVRSLFQQPGIVQEWMLSVFLGNSLPAGVAGANWPGERDRTRVGLAFRSERQLQEESGRWSFQRFA